MVGKNQAKYNTIQIVIKPHQTYRVYIVVCERENCALQSQHLKQYKTLPRSEYVNEDTPKNLGHVEIIKTSSKLQGLQGKSV